MMKEASRSKLVSASILVLLGLALSANAKPLNRRTVTPPQRDLHIFAAETHGDPKFAKSSKSDSKGSKSSKSPTSSPKPSTSIRPSGEPTISSMPSTSKAPSGEPTISSMPSTSHEPTGVKSSKSSKSCKSWKSSKSSPKGSKSDNYCSESPSMSPTISPMPSTSVAPSSTPSISMVPSSLPSAGPSATPSLSMVPSVLPSAVPSSTPSLSSKPSLSSEPSIRPVDAMRTTADAEVFDTDTNIWEEWESDNTISPGCDNEALSTNISAAFMYNYTLVTHTRTNVGAAAVFLEKNITSLFRGLIKCNIIDRRRLREQDETTHGRQLAIDGIDRNPQDQIVGDCEDFIPEDNTKCTLMLGAVTLYLRDDGKGTKDSFERDVFRAWSVLRDAMNGPPGRRQLEEFVSPLVNEKMGILGVTFVSGAIGSIIVNGKDITKTGVAASTRATTSSDSTLSPFSMTLIVAAVAGTLVMLLIAVRRRQSRSYVKEQVLLDDLSTGGKERYADFFKDEDYAETDGMSLVSSKRGARVYGEDDSTLGDSISGERNGSIIADLRSSERRYQGPNEERLANEHSGMNVHQCNSATCEQCRKTRKADPTFVPIDMMSVASSHTGYASSHHMDYASRTYVSDDTIEL